MSSRVIGIDLGTSNSCVAVMEGGSPKVIPNEEGARTTPSIVSFTKDSRLVGAPAKRQAVTNPKNTIFSAKRFIGMKFSEVEKEALLMPYGVSRSADGMCEISFGSENVPPQVVSAEILMKMKTAAENYLGEEVSEAVVTVPAYFNDSQRQATRDAGKIAGLEVKRIINEPTAAALAYGLDKQKDKTIMVYDLGGGTFDVSILEIGEGVIEVLSTSGDTHLGGDDFDRVLIDWLVAGFKAENGIDLSQDPMVAQRLKEAAEKAKIELSSTPQTDINLPFITADSSGPKHLQVSLSRSLFDQLCGHLVEKTIAPINRALKDASLKSVDVEEVILVGGSTRIPLVKTTIESFFGKQASSSVNPDEVVALGAAVQGGVFSGEVNDILLLDVSPLSLGLETMGGVMTRLIERNTTIPCNKKQVFTTAADNQHSVDIKVLQGERPMAQDNKLLGTFQLSGIPPAPRGVPQIEVTFDIDANGIVNVSAEDKGTNQKQEITISGSGKMSEEEISEHMSAAEMNAEADKEKKRLIEAENTLQSGIFNAEKFLNESGAKLDSDMSQSLKSQIESAKAASESSSVEDKESAHSSLIECLHSISKDLYSAGDNISTDQDNDDDDIIDAEYEECSSG